MEQEENKYKTSSTGEVNVETQSSVYHLIEILNLRYSEVNRKVECNLLANSMRLHSKLDLNLICNQSMFSLRKQFQID